MKANKFAPPPPFIYDPLQLPKMLDFIGAILRRSKIPVFRMEDRIVYAYRWERPSSDNDQDKLRRDDNALLVEGVSDLKMHEFVVEYVPFAEIDTSGQTPQVIPIAPPRSLSSQFMEARDRWRFPTLTGLIQAPTLREDGSLLATEGYDKASGLYLDLNGVQYPAIPDKPTRADALKALAVLKEPFEEFPFAIDPADEFEEPKSSSLSVAMSAILTGLIRRTIEFAPLHGFDAPEAGSGKGLCCNIVTLIVTGNRATAITFGDSEIEFRKLLFSALLANDQVIVFDNLTRPLEGPSLNSAMTEKTLTDRVLGVSKTATVPTNALFMANGNNLRIKGDMHRRIIAARIEPGENPEERKFKRPNLLQWVENDRPRLVVAGLTILRAYEAAGRPKVPMSEYGSYEEWSARVRAPLMWLGEADPVATRARFKASEPEREALAKVFDVLHTIHGKEWFKANVALSDAMSSDDLSDALHDADVGIDARSIGAYLSANYGRTVEGLTLQMRRDTAAKVNAFRVVEASDA